MSIGSTNSLDKSQNALTLSMLRLSTAQRINSAKDDAAGQAIASSLAAQLGSTDQASRNVYDGLSLADTAGGALGQVSESLQRMRELAVQAGNGTNSASDREAIQAEISQLSQGLDQIANNTEFNGKKLFDGSFSAQIQSGIDAGQTSAMSLGDTSTKGLGIEGLDVTQGATNALDALDNAINQVSTMQANVGATSARLNSSLANLSNSYENLSATRSRINDTDYAKETASFAQSSVQNQAAMQALNAYNAMQSGVLSLVQGSKG